MDRYDFLRLSQPQLVIGLPFPSRILSPNARPHFAAKAAAVAKQREWARLATRAAMANRPDLKYPFRGIVTQAVWYVADGRGLKRDDDNCTASLKGAWDGVADAGLVENDRQIKHLPPIVEIDKNDPRVELWVTQVEFAQVRIIQCNEAE